MVPFASHASLPCFTRGGAHLSPLRNEISDALGCELSSDSTNGLRPAHVHATAIPQAALPLSHSPLGWRYTATSRRLLRATPIELARDRIVLRQIAKLT